MRSPIRESRALTVATATEAPVTAPGHPQPTLGDELRSLFSALRRRWHWIATTTLLSLLAAITFLAVAPPKYVATAQILIDPRSKRIVEGAVVQSGFGQSAVGADTLLIDSQVELLYSTAILKKVVDDLRLAEDSEFAITRGEGVRIKLRNWLGQYRGPDYTPESAPVTEPTDNALYRLRDRHLSVRRVGNTYVINVSVNSELPDKAARIANAVAAAYVADQSTAAGDTTRAATVVLQARVDDLRRQLETAERAVEDFRSTSGLIGASGLLVDEQQLQSMNEKLAVARSAAALAKARFEIVKGLTPQSAVLSAQSDALRSPVIQNLRSNLARLERREAVIRQTLGPRHPDAASATAERASVLALINDELSRVRVNAESEYELAAANERALDAERKGLELKASANNQSAVKLRELQREAQAARQVYEAFLTRAKETREQEDLPRDSARIIGAATIPAFAASPPTVLLLAGSLVGGFLIGVTAAWLAWILDSPEVKPDRRRSMTTAGDTSQRSPATAPGMPAKAIVLSRPLLMTRAPAGRGTIRVRRPAELARSTVYRRTRDQSAPVVESAPDDRLLTLKLPRLAVAGPSGEHLTLGPGQLVTFADHIAAVDTEGPEMDRDYTHAVERVLADARRAGSPAIALLAGVGRGTGTSSAALALAYRSAINGHRTLLVDADAVAAELSLIFASENPSLRASEITDRDHLRVLLARDARSGLSLLPLALTEPDRLDAEGTRRIVGLVSDLANGYDLVLIDAGSDISDRVTAGLLQVANRLLLVVRGNDYDEPATRAVRQALGSQKQKSRVLITCAQPASGASSVAPAIEVRAT